MKTSLLIILLLFITSITFAQSEEDLAKAAQNPVANMYSFPFQNNTIYDLDGVFYLYAGEDEWSRAVDGVNYSKTKKIINFLDEPIWKDPMKALEKTRIA